MSTQYNLKSIFVCFSFLLTAVGQVTAQEPDWNSYPNVKDKVAAIRAYSGALIKKQEYDQAIPVLLKGLAFSQKASLDSFTCCIYYLLGLAYRYKVRYDSAFYYLGQAQKIADPRNYPV